VAHGGVDHGEAAAVESFGPLTLYNEHHFCINELNATSLAPRNENMQPCGDGSLTLTASATARGPGTAGVLAEHPSSTGLDTAAVTLPRHGTGP